MVEYEVRLLKADDTLAVIVKIPAMSDESACTEASSLMRGNITSAIVSLDHRLIRTLCTDQTS